MYDPTKPVSVLYHMPYVLRVGDTVMVRSKQGDGWERPRNALVVMLSEAPADARHRAPYVYGAFVNGNGDIEHFGPAPHANNLDAEAVYWVEKT